MKKNTVTLFLGKVDRENLEILISCRDRLAFDLLLTLLDVADDVVNFAMNFDDRMKEHRRSWKNAEGESVENQNED